MWIKGAGSLLAALHGMDGLKLGYAPQVCLCPAPEQDTFHRQWLVSLCEWWDIQCNEIDDPFEVAINYTQRLDPGLHVVGFDVTEQHRDFQFKQDGYKVWSPLIDMKLPYVTVRQQLLDRGVMLTEKMLARMYRPT